MRKVKYQAWDQKEKFMLSWNVLVAQFNLNNVLLRPEQCGLKLREYTGLKDSHGNEIYEGDILEAVFELIDGELKNIMDAGVVVFKDYAFQVQTFEDHHEPLHEWSQLSEELRVIGNIYENPELLPEVPQ